MYSTFTSSGLIANPDLLELPKYWEVNGHLSLFLKLQEKQVDLNRVDKVFREQVVFCRKISEWTAARVSMEKIREDIKPFLGIRPEVKEILSKEQKKFIDGKIYRLKVLGEVESELSGEMKQLYGAAGMKNLVHDKKKDIRRWPCFTHIMTDLYYLLKLYYVFEPRRLSDRREAVGKYSKELYKDIAILLEMYYPEYFKGFDWTKVKGRIKHPD